MKGNILTLYSEDDVVVFQHAEQWKGGSMQYAHILVIKKYKIVQVNAAMFAIEHWKKRIASKNCKKYGFPLEKFWYTCGISIFQRKYHTPKNFQYLEL